MSQMIEDIRYLSQDIGSRPAGTEDEQRASFYIQDRLEKSTSFDVQNEEFDCSANSCFPYIVYSCLAAIACVLSIFIKVLIVPAVVVAIITGTMIGLEQFANFALIDRFSKRNLSQNVVAKYDPKKNNNVKNPRNRKVVLVCNMDTSKNQIELGSGFIKILPKLQIVSITSVFILPLLMILNALFFQAAEGVGLVVMNTLLIMCIIFMLLPVVFNILQRSSSYSSGANYNASGVAVMLELAEKVEAISKQAPEEQKEVQEVQVSQEIEALGSSLIRESSNAVVGDEKSKQDLASARAALAAFGGGKIEHKRRNLQDNLVTVEGYAVPDANSLAYSDPLKKEDKFKPSHSEKKQAPRGVDALFGGSKQTPSKEAPLRDKQFKPVPAPHYKNLACPVPDWYVQAQINARAKDEPAGQVQEVHKVKKSRFAEAYDSYSAGQVERERILQLKSIKERKLSYAAENDKQKEKGKEELKAEQIIQEISVQEKEKDKAVSLLVIESKAARNAESFEKEKNKKEKALAEKKTEANSSKRKKEVPDWYKVAQEKTGKKVGKPEPELLPESVETEFQSADKEKSEQEQVAEDYKQNIEAFAKTADISTDKNENSDVKQVEDHMKKTLTSDEEGQRAPLDTTATDAQGAVKEMLTTLLPTIEVEKTDNPELTGTIKEIKEKKNKHREKLKSVLPSNSGIIAQKEEIIVKATVKEEAHDEKKSKEENTEQAKKAAAEVIAAEGSGKAGMTGSFSPVGSKLVKEQDSKKLDELVVEDADDSELQEGFTDTGAYAGPDYVKMPKSRVKKFFGRFLKKGNDEESFASYDRCLAADSSNSMVLNNYA
ncbi:MAG: hypothetical protein HUJ51_04765, partial [Eggerthellaceae bacterium]|nr:hypothetical protein [Eggerthellaceae bacterium]